MNFNQKVIWITGASSGIGEALATEAAAAGAQLVISARNEEKLHQLATTLNKQTTVISIPMDVTKSETFENCIQKVLNKFGRIDILINNAGIGQKSFALATKAEVEKIILDTNFHGVVSLSKLVAAHMQKQGGGQIVVTTSILGKFGLPMYAAYCASKHALYGYFDAWRGELKPHNVHINIVCPGFIKTNVSYNSLLADGSLMQKNSPAQEKGMDARVAARKILKAVLANRRHSFIGGIEMLSIPVRNMFPGIFYFLLNKMQRQKL